MTITAPLDLYGSSKELGLKLEPDKAPGLVLVIDYVERPSQN